MTAEGPRAKRIFGLLKRVRAACQAIDAAGVRDLAASLKVLPCPDRYVGLWAWSALLAPGPTFEAAHSEVVSWLVGDEADVRDAALVIAWRARSELLTLVPPLAACLADTVPDLHRLWAAQALHTLALAQLPIGAAFPELFAFIASKNGQNRFAVGSFAIGRAWRNGEKFDAASDGVARTLSIRSESEQIYAALLDTGFVPPAEHKPHLHALLSRSNALLGARALAALAATGEPMDDITSAVAKRVSGKTADETCDGLRAASALIQHGQPFSRFASAFERALEHKTALARRTAESVLVPLSERMAPEDRQREQQAAATAGLSRLAELLGRNVLPKPARQAPQAPAAPPAIDVTKLARELRDDSLQIIRGALYSLPRASLEELAQLVPALVDVLATEAKPGALAQLTRLLEAGHDLSQAMPVVAGLLLDRDYYDQLTLEALLEFLLMALARGHDIADAWPWVPHYLVGARCAGLRLELASKGCARGLGGAAWIDWLLGLFVDLDPTGHPSSVADSVRFMGLAAACLDRWPRIQEQS